MFAKTGRIDSGVGTAMFGFGWRCLLTLFLLAPVPALTQETPPEPEQVTACASVDSCIAELIADARTQRQVRQSVQDRLVTFGDRAVDSLVPLLMDRDLSIRESAGLTLAGFRRVQPKHLPALVHAWRKGDIINRRGRGNGWLPRPIAATGTDEALALLWQDYLRDPQFGSNAQVFFALTDMGEERIRPFVMGRFNDCMRDESGEACEGLFTLLSELKPAYPAWGVDAIVTLAAQARSDGVRAHAEQQLVHLEHPAGLAPTQRRLAYLSPDDATDRDARWDVQSLINAIAKYGNAGRSSGPAIAQYLGSRFHENLRAEAALALGKVGDTTTIKALLGLEPELTDDWLLAYNVAESLGRVRAEEARPLLHRLAQDHWHHGVRNNAARALNAIAGEPFARPDVAGDGRPYPAPRGEDGEEYIYMGALRFAGDDADRKCASAEADRVQTLESDPIGLVRWPRRGIQRVNFIGVTGPVAREVRQHIPVTVARGVVKGILPVRSGDLVVFAGGEFGGGLYFLPDSGEPKALIGGNVSYAWRMGNRLYVAAGLDHLGLDRGHLYVVDPVRMKVERRVRLPASPTAFSAASQRAAIVETGEGDLAVSEDGQLIDVAKVGECGE